MSKSGSHQRDVQQKTADESLIWDDETDSTEAIVQFDMPRVAAVLGIPERVLMLRMLRVLAAALAVEAAELADTEMQQQGDRLGVDGYPEGWPDLHLAAITRMRLFPEWQQ